MFDKLPADLGYTVEETNAAGYTPEIGKAHGAVLGSQSERLDFRNLAPDEQEQTTIRVTKSLAGEYPEADTEKEFAFTIAIDGTETEFTLKAGETKEFQAPYGALYEVKEADYFADGYSQSIVGGYGTANTQTIEIEETNTFIGIPAVEISGAKTWELNGSGEEVLPDSITVQLKYGVPDGSGEWHYTFTAPKYGADGKEIQYTVEELPVTGFIPSYSDFYIINTYFPPIEIDPPIIQKTVEGENMPETQFRFLMRAQNEAPMPDGSDNGTKIITLNGMGEAELGTISYTGPGVYTYTITELNDGEKGWSYDESVYVLTVTVTLENGALKAEKTLEKDGGAAEAVLFTNRYDAKQAEPNTVLIQGVKTREQGNNTEDPEENRPDSIIVYIYADGEIAVQRQVTAQDNWSYGFELPRYAEDGHEIVYTVGEAAIEGYKTQIQGYDLHNTYQAAPAGVNGQDTPGTQQSGSKTQQGSSNTKTGDESNLRLWEAILAACLIALIASIATLIYARRKEKESRPKRSRCRK